MRVHSLLCIICIMLRMWCYVVLEADAKVSGQHHISHPHPSNRWTNLYTIADISTSTHEVYVPLVL